ncbi:hypothetical protein K439DRAFT_864486 [Ramaria rubella]|nr:hypothetical protein K439DRAFT_864486 [Ramaria rubella]
MVLVLCPFTPRFASLTRRSVCFSLSRRCAASNLSCSRLVSLLTHPPLPMFFLASLYIVLLVLLYVMHGHAFSPQGFFNAAIAFL